MKHSEIEFVSISTFGLKLKNKTSNQKTPPKKHNITPKLKTNKKTQKTPKPKHPYNITTQYHILPKKTPKTINKPRLQRVQLPFQPSVNWVLQCLWSNCVVRLVQGRRNLNCLFLWQCTCQPFCLHTLRFIYNYLYKE